MPVGDNLNPAVREFSDMQVALAPGTAAAVFWPSQADAVRSAAALVAQHIVSRLVAGHSFRFADRNERSGECGACVSRDELDRFVDALLERDPDAVSGIVMALRQDGVQSEAVCDDLLLPAVRRVRSLWRDDGCDYASFRLALWRLRRVLQLIDHASPHRRAAHRDPASGLFVNASGGELPFEQEVALAGFARAGWHTQSCAVDESLPVILQTHRWHVVYISMDHTMRQQDVVACIRMVWRHARNGGVGVLCGGLALEPLPAAWEFGADAVVSDCRSALVFAEKWRMWQAESELATASAA